jgi:hypothetical protein
MFPRLTEMNYSPEEGLTLRFQPRGGRLLPEATWGHLRAANKELLLALRSIIDQTIERMDRPPPTRPRRPRRIQVRTQIEPTEQPGAG